jgi:hypothetical protein
MPFQKGKSGNPGGRAKKTDDERKIDELAREHTEQALETIVSIMQAGKTEKAQLAAAQYIIDRGYGKAPQSLEMNGSLTLNLANELAALNSKHA